VRYLPLSGPLEAITSLAAGTIQVFPGDASEVQRQVGSKHLRILAVLGGERSPGVLAQVPTAREQGFDVVWEVWRGFYAPRGISDAAYAYWVDRLRSMTASTEWRALQERNGLTPFFIGGAPFEQFVAEQVAAYRTVSREIGIIQ
jgi:putative tricarboxylic transport membrane protein